MERGDEFRRHTVAGTFVLALPDANERNGAANLADIFRSVALSAPGLIVPVICLITGSDGIGKKRILYHRFVYPRSRFFSPPSYGYQS